jgi:hypothetical protein
VGGGDVEIRKMRSQNENFLINDVEIWKKELKEK